MFEFPTVAPAPNAGSSLQPNVGSSLQLEPSTMPLHAVQRFAFSDLLYRNHLEPGGESGAYRPFSDDSRKHHPLLLVLLPQ